MTSWLSVKPEDARIGAKAGPDQPPDPQCPPRVASRSAGSLQFVPSRPTRCAPSGRRNVPAQKPPTGRLEFMRLITPMGLLLTTALLAIYSVAAAKVALVERSYPLAIAAAVSAVACGGTAYMQRWSQYLVHLMTAGFVAKWAWSVYDGYRAGYFDFQFGSPLESLRSLAPGLAMVALSGVCSWLVHAHFARAGRDVTAPTA